MRALLVSSAADAVGGSSPSLLSSSIAWRFVAPADFFALAPEPEALDDDGAELDGAGGSSCELPLDDEPAFLGEACLAKKALSEPFFCATGCRRQIVTTRREHTITKSAELLPTLPTSGVTA